MRVQLFTRKNHPSINVDLTLGVGKVLFFLFKRRYKLNPLLLCKTCHINSMDRRMLSGATHYHAQLGRPDNGRTIKGFVVCYIVNGMCPEAPTWELKHYNTP